MTWGATKKEVERSNFFKEVPKIFKRFWFPWLVSWILVAAMVILSTPLVPVQWRIDGSAWAVIFPLAVLAGCHILYPVRASAARTLLLLITDDASPTDRPQPMADDLLLLNDHGTSLPDHLPRMSSIPIRYLDTDDHLLKYFCAPSLILIPVSVIVYCYCYCSRYLRTRTDCPHALSLRAARRAGRSLDAWRALHSRVPVPRPSPAAHPMYIRTTLMDMLRLHGLEIILYFRFTSPHHASSPLPYVHTYTHTTITPATRLRALFVYTLATAAAALYATLNALPASLAARSIACIHLPLLYDSRVSFQQCS